jgi:hypothetical protein
MLCNIDMNGFAYELAFEGPECLIALMLSCPPEQSGTVPTVTLEFGNDEVTARVGRNDSAKPGLTLYATKDTIFSGVLLYNLIMARGPEFANVVSKRVAEFGDTLARRHADFESRPGSEWQASQSGPASAYSSDLFQELDVSGPDIERAYRMTGAALSYLEDNGLVVDPAFAPGLMVLAGLIPMHFSVRTPKGEKLYKEIHIDAPLWSLDIARGQKKDRPYTDVEFRFRGIGIVRKALTAMATHYLEAEESIRRGRGQPLLKRRGTPELDL